MFHIQKDHATSIFLQPASVALRKATELIEGIVERGEAAFNNIIKIGREISDYPAGAPKNRRA